jgi:hypothetical protein
MTATTNTIPADRAEFYAACKAAGCKGMFSPTSEKPFFVEWTGNTESVTVMGRSGRHLHRTVPVTTSYATAAEAVAAVKSR